MKTLVISLLLASTGLLAGCVEERGYRGDPGYRPGGPYVSERWRDGRDYDRGWYRDRARYERDRGDWRGRDSYRDRRDWRNRNNRVWLDQYERPIIYDNR